MLEKPDLQDEQIVACLGDAYGLRGVQVAFLPLGYDPNTAVYRAVAADATAYFVKLRSGAFDEIAVTLPKWLGDQGLGPIIAPIATTAGQVWAHLGAFTVILYPFVAGQNGYETNLLDRHWRELGTALKRMHTAVAPPALMRDIPQETFTPQWRESVKMFLERAANDAFDDPVALQLAAFLRAKRAEIGDLVGRAERLALALQARTPEFVVCHADLHAGNVLIDADGALYIVDWDTAILAPKERDLMFAGGGQFGAVRTPHEEEALFYQGYGQTQINPIGLAYYRYERIIQDIAVFCEQLLLTNEGGEDREQSLRYLMSNFLPGNILAIAYTSDTTRSDG